MNTEETQKNEKGKDKNISRLIESLKMKDSQDLTYSDLAPLLKAVDKNARETTEKTTLSVNRKKAKKASHLSLKDINNPLALCKKIKHIKSFNKKLAFLDYVIMLRNKQIEQVELFNILKNKKTIMKFYQKLQDAVERRKGYKSPYMENMEGKNRVKKPAKILNGAHLRKSFGAVVEDVKLVE